MFVPHRKIEIAVVVVVSPSNAICATCAEEGNFGERTGSVIDVEVVEVGVFEVPVSNCQVEVVDRSPFGGGSPGSKLSFLGTYVTRLLRAIDAGIEVHIELVEEEILRRELRDPEGRIDIGAGLPETTSLVASGISLLRIPGWRIPLRALRVRRSDMLEGRGGWSELVTPADQRDRHFLVRNGSVSHHDLSGQCGIPIEQLILYGRAYEEDLASLFCREHRSQTAHSTILVAEESTCRSMIARLVTGGILGMGEEVEVIGRLDEFPSYPLCLGIRAGLPGRLELLRTAQDRELFGSSNRQTAKLYAELMALDFLQRKWNEPAQGFSLGAGTVPQPFALATREFLEMLFKQMLSVLSGAFHARLASTGDRIDPAGIGRQVLEWAVDEPSRCEGREDRSVPIPSCRSCAAILSDGIHGGASNRYCRFCSDAAGQLRSRGDVEEVLARWIQGSRQELSIEEAHRRADRYMRSMPAWSEN